jgi:2-polyprenyl-6-methoxyphenol hydroxylase-like FAD-dependent oxidoreductase
MNNNLEILIIGAGTGGSCLAHGLVASGLKVRVFERDRTPTDRLQGYRLHISATGNRALQACLLPENLERFVRASAISNTAVSFLDSKLNRLLQIDIPPVDRMAPESERPISRIALRKILREGLEEVVVFDRTFVTYEPNPEGRDSVRFKDGSTATGDIVVGADGASSHVRAERSTAGHRDCRPVREVSARRRRPPGNSIGGVQGPDPGHGTGWVLPLCERCGVPARRLVCLRWR